jgi:adenylate kinase
MKRADSRVVKVLDHEFEIYISAERIAERIREMAAEMERELAGLNPVFLAVLNGAFFFAADLLKEFYFSYELSFVKISSYKGLKSVGESRTLIGLDENIDGRNVVVLEDIVDTGGTMSALMKQLEELNPASLRIATLILKPAAAKYKIPLDYVGFEVPDDFLVGYGLDYDSQGRNYKDIYKIKVRPMLNIVLFGPPGAGKGTQSEKLIRKYQLSHISTGDLLRTEICNNTELGLAAKKYMDEGMLVPDAVVIGMIENKLNSNEDTQGYIFDGFPRTVAQAKALDDLLTRNGKSISAMVALDVPQEELVKRLVKRGETSGRTDDNEETARKRIQVYEKDTRPVAEYFAKQNKLFHINGIGEIEEIFSRIGEVLENLTVDAR